VGGWGDRENLIRGFNLMTVPIHKGRHHMYQLPEIGFLTLAQIIGQQEVTEEQAAENRKRGKGPKRRAPANRQSFPVRKSCWWQGVRRSFPDAR